MPQDPPQPVDPSPSIGFGTALLEELGAERIPTLAASIDATVVSPDALPAGAPAVPRTLDRFRLGRLLGEGGMGRVLEAYDPELRRTVAIKVVARPASADSEALSRFVAEAQIASQLQHPNIVPVHELGVSDDGQLYFVMKRVRGLSLGELLSGLRSSDEEVAEWDRHRLLNVFAQICQAVAYTHDKGALHRDIKPANIMLGRPVRGGSWVSISTLCRIGHRLGVAPDDPSWLVGIRLVWTPEGPAPAS